MGAEEQKVAGEIEEEPDVVEDTTSLARSWIVLGAVASAAFAAGVTFMGWLSIPDQVSQLEDQAGINMVNIRTLAENQLRIAGLLADVRCTIEERPAFACDAIQRKYEKRLEALEGRGGEEQR